MPAGLELRKLREKLGLTMRDIETASEEIARRRNNEEYSVPISRLSDFETKGVIPSIYRMYSLSVIYRFDIRNIFSLYGVDFDWGQNDLETSNSDADTSADNRSQRKMGAIDTPPLAGCYFLDLLLPRKHRDALIGDIEQDYRTSILPRYGRMGATIWFWKQVIAEVIPGLFLRIAAAFVKHLWKAD